MRGYGEYLYTLAGDRDFVEAIGCEGDVTLDIPVEVIERDDCGNTTHPCIDRRSIHPRCGQRPFNREFQLVVEGDVIATDDRNLEVYGFHRVSEIRDPNALPLEETIGQPAGCIRANHAPEIDADLELDLALKETFTGQVTDYDRVEHFHRDSGVAAGVPGRQRDHGMRHGFDVVVAVERRARAANSNLFACLQAFVDEAAQVGTDTASQGPQTARAAEIDAASAVFRRPESTNLLDRWRDPVNQSDIREAVGKNSNLDRGIPLRQLGETQGIVVILCLVCSRRQIIDDHERVACTLENDSTGGLVVDHLDIQESRT